MSHKETATVKLAFCFPLTDTTNPILGFPFGGMCSALAECQGYNCGQNGLAELHWCRRKIETG